VKPIRTNRLALVPLSPAFLDALVEGRRAEAEAALGLELPPDWPTATTSASCGSAATRREPIRPVRSGCRARSRSSAG
jgi:hypothetical protein